MVTGTDKTCDSEFCVTRVYINRGRCSHLGVKHAISEDVAKITGQKPLLERRPREAKEPRFFRKEVR